MESWSSQHSFINFGIDEIADPRLRRERPTVAPRLIVRSKSNKTGSV